MRLYILLLITVWRFSSCEGSTSKRPSKNYERTIKNFIKGPTIFNTDLSKNDFPKKTTTVKGNGAKFTSNLNKVKSFSSTTNRKQNDKNPNTSSNKEFSSEISTFFKSFKKKGLFDEISKLVQDLNDVTNYKIITEQAKRRWAIPNPNKLKKNNILNTDTNANEYKFVEDIPDPNAGKRDNVIYSSAKTDGLVKNNLAAIPADKKDTITAENNVVDNESKTYIKNAKFLRDLTDLADYETWQASQNDDNKLTVPQMKQLVSNFFKLKDNDIGDSTPNEEIERFIKELNDSTNAEIKAAEDINRIRRNQTLGFNSDEYSQDNNIVEDLPAKKDKLFSYSNARNMIGDNYRSDGLYLNDEDFNTGNGISTAPNIYSTQNDYETQLGNYLNEGRKKNLSFVNYLNNATSNVPIDLNDLDKINNSNDKYSNTDIMNINSAAGKANNSSDEVYSRMIAEKGFEPGAISENGDLDSEDNQNDYDDDDYLGVADNDEGSDVVDGRDTVRSGDVPNLNRIIELSKKEEKNDSSVAKTSITNAVKNVLNVVEDTDDANNGLKKNNSSSVVDKRINDISLHNYLVDPSLTEVDIDKLQKVGFVTEETKPSNSTQNSTLIHYNQPSNDSNSNHNGNNDKKNNTNSGEITHIIISPFIQKQAKVFTDLMKSEIDSVLKEDLSKHSENFISSNDSKLKSASDMNTIDDKKYAYSKENDEDDFKQRKFDWKNHPNIYLKSLNDTTSGENDTVTSVATDGDNTDTNNGNYTASPESSRSLNNSFSNPGISLEEAHKSSEDTFTFGQPDSKENIERNEMNKKWFNYTTTKSAASNLHDSSDVFADDDVDDIADDSDGVGNFIENDDDDNTVEFLNAGSEGKSVIDVGFPAADQEEHVLDKMSTHDGKSIIDHNSDEKIIVNEIKDSNYQPSNKNVNNFFGKTKLTNGTLNSKVNTFLSGKNEVDKTINRMKLQNGTLNFIKSANKTMKTENGYDNDRFVQGIEGDSYSSKEQRERAKGIGERFLKGVAGDAKRLSNISLFITDDEEKEDEKKQMKEIDHPLKVCNTSVCDKRASGTTNLLSNSDKFLNNIDGDKGHELIMKNYDSSIKNDNFLKGVEGDAKMIAKVEKDSSRVIGPQRNDVKKNTPLAISSLLNDSKSLLTNGQFQNISTNVKKFNNISDIVGNLQSYKNSDVKKIDNRLSNVSLMAQPQIDNENNKKFGGNTDQINFKKIENSSSLVGHIELNKNSDVKRTDNRISNASLFMTSQTRTQNENGTSFLDKKLSTNTDQINAATNFKPLNISRNLVPDNNLNLNATIDNVANVSASSTRILNFTDGSTINFQNNELREIKNGDKEKAFADDFVSDKSQLLAKDRFLVNVDGDQKILKKVNGESMARFEQSNATQNLLKNCSGDCRNSLLKADITNAGRPVGAANEDVYGKNDDNDLIKEMAMEEVKALSRIKYNKDLLKDSADLQRRYYAELKSLDPEIARADFLADNVNSGLIPLEGPLKSLHNDSKKIPIIGTPRGDLNTFEINGLNYHNLVRNIHGVPNMKIDRDLSEKALRRAQEIAAEASGSSTDSITQRPGENVFIGCYSGNLSALHATKKWYNEICLHGYDFEKIGPQFGTNQFTQVVWKESTILGIGRQIATAQNGTNCTYIVALYKEIGNKMGSYKKNVKKGTFSTQTCKDLNKLFPGDESIINQYSHVKRRTVDIYSQGIGAGPNFAEEGLRAHNILRDIHGSQKMQLDPSLINAANEYAMRLASQDLSEEIPENSGENIFRKCGPKLVTAPEAVSKWYSEICGFNFDDPSSNKEKRSHFKRVIRQSSNLLGMGMAFKKLLNGSVCSFVVARYNPPEDDLGSASIYKSVFTPGMCSNIDELTSPKKSTVNGQNVDNMLISSEDDGDDVSSISPFVEDGFIAHNRYRTVHNSTLIRIDPLLSKFAREKAKELSEMDPRERINTQPGENIYVRCSQKPSTAKEAVDTWYSEVCDSPSYGFDKRDEIQTRSHFAQVVWDRSTVFGMGRANKRAANGSICSYIVARYNPPGNTGSIEDNIRKGTFNEGICKDLRFDTAKFAVPLNDIIPAKRSPRTKENRNLFFHERLEGDDEEDDEEEDLKRVVLSSFEKEGLRTHNAFRQLHGARELNIDILLSDKAQNDADRLANGVVSEKELMSDDGKVGFNTLVRCEKKPVSARTATEVWYREVCTENYDFSKPHYQRNAQHFTQLIWNKTSLLGIGSVTKKMKNGSVCSYIVAHYNPPGNQGSFRNNVFKGSFTDKVCIDIADSLMSNRGDRWFMKVTDDEKPLKKNSSSDLYEQNNTEDEFFLKDIKKTNSRNFTQNEQNNKDINEKRLKNFTEISSRGELGEEIRLRNLTKNVSSDSILKKMTQNATEEAETESNEKITSPFLGNNTEKVEVDNFVENPNISLLEDIRSIKATNVTTDDGRKFQNHQSFGDEGATRA